MNFSHAAFYPLDETAGALVSDALGNAVDGTLTGTLTGVWANAGCLTINAAAGGAGDNAIKLIDSYFDDMLRLDTLDGSSLILMYWQKQPQIPGGTHFVASYGDILNNTDGGWAINGQNHIFTYSVRGGATWQQNNLTNTEPPTVDYNDVWQCFAVQIDLFDGQLVVSGYIDDYPNRGSRQFPLESDLPRADSLGAGLRLFARGGADGSSANYCYGQTQFKRVFIGRTDGDQRHLLPIWQREFYDATSGIPDFMVN